MTKEPDEIKEVRINKQKIKIYQFNSDSPSQKIKAKVYGSVSKVINCEIDSADLHKLGTDLISRIDTSSGEVLETNPETISEGDSAIVMFEPTRLIVIEPESEYPSLGRFAIRNSGETIGAGICIDVEEKNMT